MMKFKDILLVTSLVIFSACASAPDYRPASGSRSAGYSETQIESNRYRVSYRLNDNDYTRAQSLAMRRAAELTLESGYDTFELVSQSSDRELERERVGRTTGPDRVVQRNCGLLGCSTTTSPVPRDPFDDGFERDRASVMIALEIIMSDKDAAVSPSLYDASEVFANLSGNN